MSEDPTTESIQAVDLERRRIETRVRDQHDEIKACTKRIAYLEARLDRQTPVVLAAMKAVLKMPSGKRAAAMRVLREAVAECVRPLPDDVGPA